MALIKKLDKLEKQRNSIHSVVECTYTIFTDVNGNKILQLDTYGSNNREFRGKVSQSMQFDKDSAEKLLKLISNEFLND